MDILYVLGQGSKWSNNELRYSLRSIAKFGENVGKVFVVGYDPGFLTKKVTFVSCPDVYPSKHQNIMNCIETAIATTDIGEEFLLSSDDHFYVEKVDFDKYPYYSKGMLPDSLEENETGIYRTSLCDTSMLLKAAGLGTRNFSWHGNTHFNHKVLKSIKPIIDVAYRLPYGCEPTCLMLNALYKKKKFEYEQRRDCKITEFTTHRAFCDEIQGRESFSVSDKALRSGLAQVIVDMFPEPCDYEH